MPPAAVAHPAVPVVNPVVVTVGPTLNGERLLRLLAAEPLVVATPVLQWLSVAAAAGAAALVEMPEWKILAVFGCKARLGPAPADRAAGEARSLLTLHLTAAFWSRYLTELTAAGLLAGSFEHRQAVKTRTIKLTPVNPANLQVAAADWDAQETFDHPGAPAVAAVAAVARRRGAAAIRAAPGRAATPAVLGPPDLRFISRCNITLLESADGAAPWGALCRGASMLGGTATRAIRLDDMSMLGRVSAPLRASVARYVGVDPTPAYDATLAGALQDFLKNVVLMDGLSAHGTSEGEFMAEALDSFRAHRSAADKLAVEEARFHLLEHECALPLASLCPMSARPACLPLSERGSQSR